MRMKAVAMGEAVVVVVGGGDEELQGRRRQGEKGKRQQINQEMVGADQEQEAWQLKYQSQY